MSGEEWERCHFLRSFPGCPSQVVEQFLGQMLPTLLESLQVKDQLSMGYTAVVVLLVVQPRPPIVGQSFSLFPVCLSL